MFSFIQTHLWIGWLLADSQGPVNMSKGVLQLGHHGWNDGGDQECCQVGSSHNSRRGGNTCCVCSRSRDSCQQTAKAGVFFFVMSQWVTEEEWWSFSWRGEKKTDVFTDVICRLTSFSVSCFQCGLTAAPAVGSWMQRLLDSFEGGLFKLLPTQTEGLGLRFGCSGVRCPILVGRPTECTQGCAGKQHQCCVHCCRPKPTLIVVGLAFESLCSL